MAAGFQIPTIEPDEFHFVVLGDTQFHDPAKFNRIIDQTRRLGPAFVIQVGDLIEGYNSDLDTIKQEWQRFERQVAPLAPIHFLPIPGNHDVYNGDRKVDKRLEQLYQEAWGPLYYSFVYKNTLIVGLNSDSAEGVNQIKGKQLKWLKSTLEKSDAEHKFVFMHRPPLQAYNADELHNLFVRHGVSHVFYGHHHHYHFLERDGVAYTMTNAAANTAHEDERIGGFHHMLQVSVRGAEVDVAVIKADAIKAQNAVHPIDNYDYFALQTQLAPDKIDLTRQTKNQFELAIPLNNASKRDIQIMVSCTSDDNRWQISPTAIAPITLASNAKHTLKLTASFADNRIPESTPTCQLNVPFQTTHGDWIQFTKSIQT